MSAALSGDAPTVNELLDELETRLREPVTPNDRIQARGALQELRRVLAARPAPPSEPPKVGQLGDATARARVLERALRGASPRLAEPAPPVIEFGLGWIRGGDDSQLCEWRMREGKAFAEAVRALLGARTEPPACTGPNSHAEYNSVVETAQRLADEVEALRGGTEPSPDAIRDRDALWCRALIGALDTDDVHAVTKLFNELRPDVGGTEPSPAGPE